MGNPFDTSGTEVGADGIRRYTGLPQNLLHMLRQAVEAHPERTAVVELGGERVSYRDLWDRSARVAGGLRAAGVQPGDRVAIRKGNGLDWVLAFWGTLLAGGVVVPVNTRFAQPEVDYVVGDSGARYVVEPDAALPDGEPLTVIDQAHTDVAGIFYTSGTTGFPKGAMTTHENFLSNVETCLRCLSLDRDEHLSTLISVPLFHVTGCNSQLLVLTAIAGTSVVMPVFEVGAFLTAVETERISVLTTVPTIYWLALQSPAFACTDTSSVRSLSYGGAPIAPDLVHRIQRAFPTARVGNGFGLSETSSVSTYLPHEDAAEHADSVGYPAPVVDVRLDDVDPTSGVGELLIRGPHVVAGYWGKPEQTAEAFAGGWLHSGDLARIDDEGRVYVVDRKKDMINRGGENVYCVEVENALAAHPAVGEVAVLGVPDPVMGEKVGAVVVPRPGTTVVPAELRAFAATLLADFKVPQFVAVRDDPLPRNPGGKVLKPTLREQTPWTEMQEAR
ncbi:Acyl-CoA synthetase (AMP-forming)/AMP-acid ligase II [Klenkia marina]|uniref:Acyl-CoA synthetase (AMP-forming)/AMP-acid ligase II n=1 Tax=Klenkia marina TaxID=1960309 RepID=A0A1G4YTA2_9ACTN|nr:AMP-binding protein [Klenkia marina]SCX56601.1 Acyl-CoA synthetase (AMP-forming)/AMP-acid ligase II [Klenkia marina]